MVVVDDVVGRVVLVVTEAVVEDVDEEVAVVDGDEVEVVGALEVVEAGPTKPDAACSAPTSEESCRTPHPLASS